MSEQPSVIADTFKPPKRPERVETNTLKRWDDGPNARSGWQVMAAEGGVWAHTTDDTPDCVWLTIGPINYCLSRERAEDLAECLGELLF